MHRPIATFSYTRKVQRFMVLALRSDSAAMNNPLMALEKRMLSALETMHVIETAFLPTICNCEISPAGALTVTLIEDGSSHNILTVTGILMSELASSRAIAALVIELREELRLRGIIADERKLVGRR